MKKIIFEVSTKKESSITDLIKKVNHISCRINIDLKNSLITVEDIDDEIDEVIELIDSNYVVSKAVIDNTTSNSENYDVLKAEERQDVEERVITIADSHPEEDLIINKVEFQNEYVEQLLNKFLKTAYWAMYKMNVSEKEIGRFIWTLINEVSIRYTEEKRVVPFSIGDIVDCNYGQHLPGEINGTHISAIVCNVLNENMVYLVPFTKETTDITSKSYLPVVSKEDVIYDNYNDQNLTALLDKGKYVRAERLNCVIGKATPEFLKKVLIKLPSTFDFTSAITEDGISETTQETPTMKEDTSSKEKTKISTKKIGGEETALLEMFEDSFDKLDSTKKVEEQIEDFLTGIGMPISEKLVTKSFIIACDIKKINYGNIILELHKLYPTVNEDMIKANLKDNFKNWLEKYPELAKRCPKISLMSVLKVFAKRLKA